MAEMSNVATSIERTKMAKVKAILVFVYLRALLWFTTCIFLVTLLVNISSVVGLINTNQHVNEVLLIGSLAATFAGCSVAKERNVWANEFKSSPKWLRGTVLSFVAYGGLIALAQMFFLGGGNAVLEDTVSASAFSLGFDALGFCILYSVLYSGSSNEAELVRRARNSFIVLFVVLAFIIAVR